jgi:16S rRNA (guanine527-N7)-methyltransferase
MTTEHALLQAFAANTLAVSEEKRALLARYADFLLEWNEKINLISRVSADAFAVQHIADSVLAADMLPEAKTILDLGSGGGLPGIVIAIMHPQKQVTLAETKEKKIKFLQNCVRSLNLQNVRVHDAAHNAGAPHLKTHAVLVCRAFSTLENIARESKKYLVRGGKIYAYKGRRETAEAEMRALPQKLRAQLSSYLLKSPDGEISERTLVVIDV